MLNPCQVPAAVCSDCRLTAEGTWSPSHRLPDLPTQLSPTSLHVFTPGNLSPRSALQFHNVIQELWWEKKKKKCSMLSMGWAQNAALKQSFSFCSHHKAVMFLKQMSLLHFACSVQRQSYLGKFFKHRFSLLYSRTFLTHQTLTGSLLLWVWLFSYSARGGWKNSSLETLKSLLWQNMHLVYAFYKSAFKQRDAFMIMCKC